MRQVIPQDHGSTTLPRQVTQRPGPVLPYLIWCELLKLARMPRFIVPTIAFPVFFFAFFGLPLLNNDEARQTIGPYLLTSFGAYAVASIALFSFGVAIAAERGLGWNTLLRITPLQPLTIFVAKTVMALIFGVVVLVFLLTFGRITGVQMPLTHWFILPALLVLGMIPFVTLGLLLGYVTGPNSAAAVANLLFLPLSFASGLFVPIQNLPAFVQQIAPYLPTYHLGQLGWTYLGAGDGHSLGFHFL